MIDAHRTSWRLDQGPKTLSMAKSNIFLMHWHCHRITPQLNELVSHTSLSLLITSSPSRLSDQIATEAIHATPSMEKAPNAASSAKWTPSTLPPTPRLRSPFWEDSKFCPRSSRIRLHFFRRFGLCKNFDEPSTPHSEDRIVVKHYVNGRNTGDKCY